MVELQALGPDLWVVSQALAKAKGLGCRMTVVRNSQRELFLLSPVPLTSDLVAELNGLGAVVALIAPNGMHHLFIADARRHFPKAKVYGPEILKKKRKDLIPFEALKDNQNYPWSSVLESLSIPARPILGEEFIFFHRESKTLIVFDALFNLQKVDNFLMGLFLRINGNYKKLVMSRLGRFLFNDRAALRRAVAQMKKWQPEQLVVAHGEIIRSRASEAVVRAFEWLE